MMPYGYDYNQQPTGYFNTNYRPQQPQMQQPAQHMTANVNWIYVNGIGGARDHIVQPGQTAWMMDNNDPVIYVKAVDSMGSANLRCFQLVELQPGAQQAQEPQAPQIDMSDYATKSDIERLEKQLNKLMNEFGGMQA